LSNGCAYGAVQAIWAQDAQFISIDIIENVVTLADSKSRDFSSRIEPQQKFSATADGCSKALYRKEYFRRSFCR
jgi:hypothetical protein